jgi:hemerythrin-like domain-containing protein
MTTDALLLLKAEHKEIKDVFRKFERAGSGATKLKSSLVKKMIELLTVHTYVENELIYPEVRKLLPDLEDDILESYEEHHVADLLVLELIALPASAERFAPKATVLIELVRHHIEEEEQNWVPEVRAGVGRKQLSELGARMAQMKRSAPRSPAQPSAMKKALDAVIK